MEIGAKYDQNQSNEISKIAANMWAGESQQVRNHYRELAKQLREEYKTKNPYPPVSSISKKQSKRSTKNKGNGGKVSVTGVLSTANRPFIAKAMGSNMTKLQQSCTLKDRCNSQRLESISRDVFEATYLPAIVPSVTLSSDQWIVSLVSVADSTLTNYFGRQDMSLTDTTGTLAFPIWEYFGNILERANTFSNYYFVELSISGSAKIHLTTIRDFWLIMGWFTKRQEIVDKYGLTKSNEISKIAADMWAKEKIAVRNYYKQLSLQEHTRFKEMYPDYEWQPWNRKRTPKSGTLHPTIPRSSRRNSTASSAMHTNDSISTDGDASEYCLSPPMNPGYSLNGISQDVFEATRLDHCHVYYPSSSSFYSTSFETKNTESTLSLSF
ncbi:hypothetical protein HDV06_000412 [Boothiomyces sp. JEL0866]|nr:hypothetical protein HDV06_000412 [Boothiomyces sp. JEL0866]